MISLINVLRFTVCSIYLHTVWNWQNRVVTAIYKFYSTKIYLPHTQYRHRYRPVHTHAHKDIYGHICTSILTYMHRHVCTCLIYHICARPYTHTHTHRHFQECRPSKMANKFVILSCLWTGIFFCLEMFNLKSGKLWQTLIAAYSAYCLKILCHTDEHTNMFLWYWQIYRGHCT